MSSFQNKLYEPFTPQNSTFLLVDYNIAFTNVIRSHTPTENLRNAKALMKTALAFNTGLIFNLGVGQYPYPELAQLLGNRPIVWRGSELNAWNSPIVVEAVRKTGRSHLVVAGLTTEGCVGRTAMSALRDGYTVSLCVDATAGETTEAHEVALQRLVQAGVVPYTWGSLLDEFQGSWQDPRTNQAYFEIRGEASPEQGFYFGLLAKNMNPDSTQAQPQVATVKSTAR
jgi:nicotinamidase-related amidase